MNKLKQFNEFLGRISFISQDLEVEIMRQEWDPVKKFHAVQIIDQLDASLIHLSEGGRLIYTTPLKLSLAPCVCGIKEDTEEKMLSELRKYLESLLDELNELPTLEKEIIFSYSGHNASNLIFTSPCIFEIDWCF